jgi:predicted RNA-binding Zn-ribbon protein involved in translation (DUF1610 family)
MQYVTRTRDGADRLREDETMTTIKASCPTCGEVEMTSNDVMLMVCNHAPLSYYAFDCPSCADEVRKPADDHVISLLMSGGVRAQVWEVPAEALEPKAGPALTYDDLLDFALLLSNEDDIAARISEAITG